MSVKHVIDPNYQNLLLPSFFEFRDLLDSATKNILSENLKTFDDKTMKTTDSIEDDIANIQITNNSYMKMNDALYLKIIMKFTMMSPRILKANIAS